MPIDEVYFLQLYHQHAQRLYRRVLKILRSVEDAEDVVQHVWLKLWQHPPQQEQYVVAWLNRVTENATIDVLRHRYVQTRHQEPQTTIDDLMETLVADEPSPEIIGELSEQASQAMGKLGGKYRQAIFLHHIEGLTIAEIAEATGDKPFAIRTRLSRGRNQFKVHFLGKDKGTGEYIPVSL